MRKTIILSQTGLMKLLLRGKSLAQKKKINSDRSNMEMWNRICRTKLHVVKVIRYEYNHHKYFDRYIWTEISKKNKINIYISISKWMELIKSFDIENRAVSKPRSFPKKKS